MIHTEKLQATECMRLDITFAMDVLHSTEGYIPDEYFADCFGVLFLSAKELGMIAVSGTTGSGILMSHNPTTNSWSSPISVNLSGLGIGLTLGSERKNMIVFFHSRKVMNQFATDVHIKLGSKSVRTWGGDNDKDENHSLTPLPPSVSGFLEGEGTTAFTISGGQCYGMELQGAILTSNKKRHRDFYGPSISPKRILSGKNSVRCNQRSGVHLLQQKLAELASSHHRDRHERTGHKHSRYTADHRWMAQGTAPVSAS